jgi:hypothetical protein
VVWEAIFLLLILKIPIVYLGCVVWWAVRAKPELPPPLEGARVAATPLDPEPRSAWSRRYAARRRPRPGPHGSPLRRYARQPVPAGSKTVR